LSKIKNKDFLMPFTFKKTLLTRVALIASQILEDHKESEFSLNGISERFIQDNHHRSSKGLLRGLHHWLNPYAQGKIIICISGSTFNAAIGIRKSSLLKSDAETDISNINSLKDFAKDKIPNA